ncbi:hypothetical protein IAD21_06220 [Abditibacteriota bacterium]|nr:hypothetical protein IAD21_06220 [Abditibacteriota bacterium]
MKNRHRIALAFALLLGCFSFSAWAQLPPLQTTTPSADPLQMTFYRQSVKRFIFSNNIPLSSLNPDEIVGLDLMHPLVGNSTTPCSYVVQNGVLEISSAAAPAESARYVGGASPYAVYEADVQSINSVAPIEVALDWAAPNDRAHLQVIAKYPAARDSIVLRLIKNGQTVREQVLFTGPAPAPPYKLRVQLGGINLAAFYTKNGQTTYLGRTQPEENFREVLDLRDRKMALGSTFNILTRLPTSARVVLGGAASYLSAGVGQADIRLITHRDGAPFIDNSRLWFTFSARGLGIGDSAQGIMSFDPSTSDFRMEGIVAFDHGDGLLRNDYASHLFYDDEAHVWRAWVCDFGGVAGREGRGASGLIVAESAHDPRRGLSVMRAAVLSNIAGQHEDPCGFYDADAKKWRLLTTDLNRFQARLFESNNWDGPYTPIAGPVAHNSTGTLIQKIGGKRYIFSGSSENAIFVYSYPELKELGKLKMDLPPFGPKGNARVWPNVFALPVGYPARYMALMMDRPNFPGVAGANWSYGALYLYSAYTDDITTPNYEFPAP